VVEGGRRCGRTRKGAKDTVAEVVGEVVTVDVRGKKRGTALICRGKKSSKVSTSCWGSRRPSEDLKKKKSGGLVSVRSGHGVCVSLLVRYEMGRKALTAKTTRFPILCCKADGRNVEKDV